MDIKKGDKVVALKHVIARAKSMDIDVSGEGTVEQLKDVGMSTEQALVVFPYHRCWIYVNEISKEKASRTVKEEIQEHGRVVGNRKAAEATEVLNTAIDTLISTERLFEQAGLIVEKNFIIRIRQRAENLRDDLARAIAL